MKILKIVITFLRIKAFRFFGRSLKVINAFHLQCRIDLQEQRLHYAVMPLFSITR